MWPLGHTAVAYLCYSVVVRAREAGPPDGLVVVVLLFGSQFPDLVDKPLSWYLGVLPTGRTLAHSLLVVGPLVVAVYLLAARYSRSAYGIAFGMGAISHVLVDAVPALWGGTDPGFLLWPVVAVEPYDNGAPSVAALLFESIGDPYFLSEFVLAAIAVVVWRRDGYPGLGVIRRVGRRWLPAGG